MQAQAAGQRISHSARRLSGSVANASKRNRAASPKPSRQHTPRISVRAACAWSRAWRCTWPAWRDGFIVKRMPEHRQPPRTRLPVLRTAGRSCPGWGRCWARRSPKTRPPAKRRLKLDFPMSRFAGRSTTPAAGEDTKRGRRRREAVAARAAALPVGPGRTDALAARLRRQAHLGHGAQAPAAGGREQDRARWRVARPGCTSRRCSRSTERDGLNARRDYTVAACDGGTGHGRSN